MAGTQDAHSRARPSPHRTRSEPAPGTPRIGRQEAQASAENAATEWHTTSGGTDGEQGGG